MLLNKINFLKNLKEIKLAYIIVEILLIFISLIGANYFIEMQQSNAKNIIIKENLNLFVDELKDNNKVNSHYVKVHAEINTELDSLSNLFYDGLDEVNQTNLKSLFKVSNTLSVATKSEGLKNIIKNDINNINDKKLLKKLERTDLLIKWVKEDVNNYNREIDKLRDIMFELFLLDYENSVIKSINLNKLKGNHKFINQLQYTILLRKYYVDDLEYFIKGFEELIIEIEESIK